ncbi:MAG: pyridoxal 4-dehydrogenase, SDR-type [Alphaproteobacteria bacterium]
MKRYEDRVVIVSGAAQGIGRAIAERIGQEGATVVVVDINGDGAQATAEAIGGGAFAVTCDIGDPDSVNDLHKAVMGNGGRIDALVNAAAIVPFVAWDDLTFEEWRRIMRVNLDGLYLMCRASSDIMRKAKYGRIVNICSNALFAGTPNMAHYVASKGGVFGFTRALATELGGDKITVNAVAPGLTDTEGVQTTPHKDTFEFVEMLQAIKGRGEPADIAPAVAFLASEEAHWVTGQTLAVDGGMIRW